MLTYTGSSLINIKRMNNKNIINFLGYGEEVKFTIFWNSFIFYRKFYLFNLGSNASRKPSPSKLTAKTVNIIAIEGNIARPQFVPTTIYL